jgi:hypothetical protein
MGEHATAFALAYIEWLAVPRINVQVDVVLQLFADMTRNLSHAEECTSLEAGSQAGREFR